MPRWTYRIRSIHLIVFRHGEDDGVVPKRAAPEIVVPSLSADDQLRVDHADPPNAPLMPGARVFARWPDDKNFYPGHVVNRDGLGRYKVKYIDEKVRDMPPPDVVPLAALVPGRMVWWYTIDVTKCLFSVHLHSIER